MKGIGIDLCGIERFQEIEKNQPRFFERYFSSEERSYLDSRGVGKAESAAAMFAAKEAFLKAVGVGLGGGILLQEIIVVHDAGGAPSYRLCGGAEDILKKRGAVFAFLSLTHEKDYACAVCVLE